MACWTRTRWQRQIRQPPNAAAVLALVRGVRLDFRRSFVSITRVSFIVVRDLLLQLFENVRRNPDCADGQRPRPKQMPAIRPRVSLGVPPSCCAYCQRFLLQSHNTRVYLRDDTLWNRNNKLLAIEVCVQGGERGWKGLLHHEDSWKSCWAF